MDEEFRRLNRELTSARQEYRQALEEAARALEVAMDLDLANPDGAPGIRRARISAKEAWDKYKAVMKAFLDYKPR